MESAVSAGGGERGGEESLPATLVDDEEEEEEEETRWLFRCPHYPHGVQFGAEAEPVIGRG